MQVLLEEENIKFKKTIASFVDSFFENLKESTEKSINLKKLWSSLYNKGFISKENSLLKNILLTETVCEKDPGTGLFLLTQFGCIEIVKKYERTDLLEKLYSGEVIGCFSLTEPNAGSDITLLETKAKKNEKNWILNGRKIWASNATISNIIILFAQTKEHKDKSGITCFLVPSNSTGLEILNSTPKLGIKTTPSSEILINNVSIPDSEILGNIGDGIKIALSTITLGRLFCAAQAVGLMQGILQECIFHSTKRNQFGKSISENQAIQWYLADMTKDLDAARLLLYKAVWSFDNSPNELNKLASMAKYFSTTKAQIHSSKAVQILGGKGLLEDSFVTKAYKDSKVLEIYEGTNEIQKIIIGRELNLN